MSKSAKPLVYTEYTKHCFVTKLQARYAAQQLEQALLAQQPLDPDMVKKLVEYCAAYL